ncbi:MAG TPA: Rrf2 family transcriptional regulator [Chloroflexota bacterium]|nr:Rrf2 family transcriptional regulator [Chloroflexota bacterium]
MSTRTEYGVRAMLELARQYGHGPVQSHDIAQKQGIPEPYLNQLLTQLRKAGLIVSRRGPGGGHSLARPANEVTIAELITALEGSLWPIEEGTEQRRTTCYALRELLQELSQQAEQLLRSRTLADLLERERRRAYVYHI